MVSEYRDVKRQDISFSHTSDESYEQYRFRGDLTWERRTNLVNEILSSSPPERRININLSEVEEIDTTFVAAIILLIEERKARATASNTKPGKIYIEGLSKRGEAFVEISRRPQEYWTSNLTTFVQLATNH